MFTLLSFDKALKPLLLLFSLLFPVFVSKRERKNECQNKKKISSPLALCPPFFTATLSEPHDGSSTPLLICRKQRKREKREEEKFLSLFSAVLFFLSLKEGSLSLSERRISLSLEDALTPRRSIRDRGRCGRGVLVLVVCARARKSTVFSEKKKKTRGENSNVFFFPETRGRQTTEEEKQRDKERF